VCVQQQGGATQLFFPPNTSVSVPAPTQLNLSVNDAPVELPEGEGATIITLPSGGDLTCPVTLPAGPRAALPLHIHGANVSIRRSVTMDPLPRPQR
jgi:hypothetical protein